MISLTRRHTLAQLAAFGASASLLAAVNAKSAEAPAPQGPAILTIAGQIGVANRGAVTADTVGFFKHNSITFAKAMAFDRKTLLRLPQQEVTATVYGSEAGKFSGPLLQDVLTAAGAGNAAVRLMALDGFAVELSAAERAALNWTLALSWNANTFGIGDFGPTWLVHTPASGVSPSEAEGQKWVWSVFYIEVM